MGHFGGPFYYGLFILHCNYTRQNPQKTVLYLGFRARPFYRAPFSVLLGRNV